MVRKNNSILLINILVTIECLESIKDLLGTSDYLQKLRGTILGNHFKEKTEVREIGNLRTFASSKYIKKIQLKWIC